MMFYSLLFSPYRQHYQTIVPFLIMNKDEGGVCAVATELTVQPAALLQSCFIQCIVHIFPLFAASEASESAANEVARGRVAKATASFDLIGQYLSEDVRHCVLERLLQLQISH